MTESEIIKQCSYSYDTSTWVWIGHQLDAPKHPIDEAGRQTVEQSKYLRFTQVVVHGRLHKAVEIVEAPLIEYIKTLTPSQGLFFAGRFYRSWLKS